MTEHGVRKGYGCCGPGSNGPGKKDAEFEALVKEFVSEIFKRSPIEATFMGVHDYDAELDDFSRAAVEEEIDWLKRMVARFEAIVPDSLSLNCQVDRDIVIAACRHEILSSETIRGWEKNPGMYVGAPLAASYILAVREFAPIEERLANMAERIGKIPQVLEEGKKNIKNPPRVFVETSIDSARGGLGFFMGLVPVLAERAPEIKAKLLEASDKAVKAIQEYIAFMEGLLPEAKGEFAVGEEVFNELLHTSHMVEWNADYLLRRGRELFDETIEQLEETAARIDASRTWEEILEEIKAEHPSADTLVDYYREQMARVRQFVAANDLVDIPEGEELIVEATPPFQRPTIPYAAYMSPAPFEKEQVGRFWVTPPDPGAPKEVQEAQLRGHSIWGIPTTCGHEAYPGHHLQLVWANRSKSLARKFAHSTLFAEGWAFYTEELLESMGYLADPRTKLSRLADQLWRAGRIILDASLHTGRMSVDQAVDFMVEKIHHERPNALAEVRRYTTSPTQPMSYLMGKLEILKIYEDYKAAKGGSFALKEFHNELLSHGTIPPAAVRRLIFR